MILRLALLVLPFATPAVAAAQATDPAAVGLILSQRGTSEGYVDRARARARQRGSAPARAVSGDCLRAWRLHDRMTRAEKRQLYDLCPR